MASIALGFAAIGAIVGGGTFAGIVISITVGAVIGGITAAVTGGDILEGMLYGAVGGLVLGGVFGTAIAGTGVLGSAAQTAAVSGTSAVEAGTGLISTGGSLGGATGSSMWSGAGTAVLSGVSQAASSLLADDEDDEVSADTKYTTDANLEASKYSSDASIESSRLSAGGTIGAANIAANQGKWERIYDTDEATKTRERKIAGASTLLTGASSGRTKSRSKESLSDAQSKVRNWDGNEIEQGASLAEQQQNITDDTDKVQTQGVS